MSQQHKTHSERRAAIAPTQGELTMEVLRTHYPNAVSLTQICATIGAKANAIASRICELKRDGWRILGAQSEYGMEGLEMVDNGQQYQLLSLTKDEPYLKHIGGLFVIEHRPGNGGLHCSFRIDSDSVLQKDDIQELKNRIQDILNDYKPAQPVQPLKLVQPVFVFDESEIPNYVAKTPNRYFWRK